MASTEEIRKEELLGLRQKYVSPSLSIHYSKYKPLHIIRGDGLYLIDEKETKYLDCINNVALVGHSHPRLVAMLHKQLTTPNMSMTQDCSVVQPSEELLEEYKQKLFSTLPDSGFDTILFVRSGSEANDLAVSIAREVTGHEHVIALDGAYHGHTQATLDISTYKQKQAKVPGTIYEIGSRSIIASTPDMFRGKYTDPSTAGVLFANDVKKQIVSQGSKVAAFISEPFLGTAGQVPLPPGYLPAVYKHVHEAGGLCIADEVQTGFARAGSTFWLHQFHGVVPDILIIGKPMANGHPISGVVTRHDIVQKFINGRGKYILNEFVTDPLSLGLALTVLDIIRDEGLQENALLMGKLLLERLSLLKQKYNCIGDVRGTGLFIGVEIVTCNENGLKVPNSIMAQEIVKRALLEHNVLLREDGVDGNVIKIKPPITFAKEHADILINALDTILSDIFNNSIN